MYYVSHVDQQVSDTNMFEHTDYLSYYRWFDRARTKLYSELLPGLKHKPHGLILVDAKVDYLKPTYVTDDLEVRTWTSRIGTKSFELTQQLWRWNETRTDSELCADSRAVLCAIDFTTHRSEPLSAHYRSVLEQYLWNPDAT